MANKFEFLPAYAPIFYEDKIYWIISGGRGSGKSTNIAAYFLVKLMAPEYFRGVIGRYTQKALTNSIYRDITDLIAQWGLETYLEIKGDEIRNTRNDNLILTHALKLAEGGMSAKGKGLARVTHLLLDECTELPSEEEYLKLIDSFRQKDAERKIFLLFNPTQKSHWIFKRFYLPDGRPNPKWLKNHGFLHTTYLDNKDNLDPTKILEWEDLAQQDPEYFSHHILGEWRDIGEGQVFKSWQFEWDLPDGCEVLYGLDFGFSSDPTAMVRVHKRGKKLWVEQILYNHGLTNQDISELMLSSGVDKSAVIIADAAEPKSIEELRRQGWRNVRAAAKGPDSIRAGIQKIRGYEVKVNQSSEALIEEFYQYAYRTGTDQPIDSYNHLMDAFRYALSHDAGETPKYAMMGRIKKTTTNDWDF